MTAWRACCRLEEGGDLRFELGARGQVLRIVTHGLIQALADGLHALGDRLSASAVQS
jgi:hypothetical protein